LRTEIKISQQAIGFIRIGGGAFFMGSNLTVTDRRPMVRVKLSDFYMAEYPVTQPLFEAVMGYNRSHFRGDRLPVTNISYDDAVAFCRRLMELSPGKVFRLPTEAEWEWAASSGWPHRFAGSDDPNEVAWHEGNSGARLQPVGQKKPNAFGLFDMSGNVWEWCSDVYRNKYADRPWPLTPTLINPAGSRNEGNNRVLRGGCYLFNTEVCAVRTRSRRPPSGYSAYVGFRVVMEL
jgi:formylglycine-generating enzyme required for sulfatase activity